MEADALHRRVIVRITRITSSGGQEGSDDVNASAPLYGELSEAHCTDAPCTSGSSGVLPVVGTVMRDLLVLQHILAVTHHRSTLPAAAAATAAAATAAAAAAAPLAYLLLTAKPALRYAARASSSSSSSATSMTLLPSSISVLRPGLMLIGYVVQITALGTFVRFLDACTGLAPRNRWPSTASSGASTVDGDHAHKPLVIGQTVACVVHSVNADTAAKESRFALDLTPLALSRCLTPSLLSSSVSESLSVVCLRAASTAASAALLRPQFSLAGLLQRGGMAAHEAVIAETADHVAATAWSSPSSGAVDADAARHVPTRAEYPIGRLCVIRIVEVSAPVSGADTQGGGNRGAAAAPAAQSAVVLMPPPLTAVPTGGVAESSSSGAAVVFGFASSLRVPGRKAGQCVLARVLDIDLSRRVVLIVLGGDVPHQLPCWVNSPSSAGVSPQQHRLSLGDISKVRVIHMQMGSPSTHFSTSSRVAVVEVLTEGAAGTAAAAPNPIGFAVLDDAFGSLLSRDDVLAPGSVLEAIVTQVPLAAAASGGGAGAKTGGKRRREGSSSSSNEIEASAAIGNSVVPPAFAAEDSMDTMLLLSLVRTTREAKRQGLIKDASSSSPSSSSTAAAPAAATAASLLSARSGGGGWRGATASLSVSDLVTGGMTVSAYTVPPRIPTAKSTVAAAASPSSSASSSRTSAAPSSALSTAHAAVAAASSSASSSQTSAAPSSAERNAITLCEAAVSRFAAQVQVYRIGNELRAVIQSLSPRLLMYTRAMGAAMECFENSVDCAPVFSSIISTISSQSVVNTSSVRQVLKNHFGNLSASASSVMHAPVPFALGHQGGHPPLRVHVSEFAFVSDLRRIAGAACTIVEDVSLRVGLRSIFGGTEVEFASWLQQLRMYETADYRALLTMLPMNSPHTLAVVSCALLASGVNTIAGSLTLDYPPHPSYERAPVSYVLQRSIVSSSPVLSLYDQVSNSLRLPL